MAPQAAALGDTFRTEDSFFDAAGGEGASPSGSPGRRGELYRSIHPGTYDPRADITKRLNAATLGVKEKHGHATFGGPLGTFKPDPLSFTRKHEREPQLPPPGPPTRPKEKVKQPVPLRTEVPPHGLVTTKNFIVANALETILAEPKRPKEEPLPTQKKDYGKVPRYLQTVKAKIAEEKELVASYLKAQEEASQTHRRLTDAEKEELLYQLKVKWETVNGAYLKLPLSCETAGQRARKEALEKELAQLEVDIKKLSRPVVMVEIVR